ncbi:16S rRNA (uracil(1498)-N(3))-methyltransferase [Candidatus Wolfebacteria bacterium]|nr:16S rRNA (uracil(1498)-N(3))-methyltransferase [Candidatus Wolfebacteria bacterium]
MKLHRFFGNFDLNLSQIEIFDKNILNQLKNVLRLKSGDKIILCDGNSNEAFGVIDFLSKNLVKIKIEKVYKNENEPKNYVILYCAILKKENFELIVQKATEIGIKEIVPIISERTIKLSFKSDRMEKIIKEAAEQSDRGELPILQSAINFEDAVKNASKNNLNLFFNINGEKIDQENQQKENQKIGIFIGPEGGWSENELAMIKKSGNFKIKSLGSLVLRAETAAIAASYIAVNKFI